MQPFYKYEVCVVVWIEFFFSLSIYADLVDQSGGFGNFDSSSKDQKKSKYFNDYKADSRSSRDEVTSLTHWLL